MNGPPIEQDPAVLKGIAEICAQRWYDAHETLEDVWRPTPKGPRKRYLQGLIQAAVGLEHLRRGNPRGAWGQWNKARAKLIEQPPVVGGLEVAAWIDALDAFYAGICLTERKDRQLARQPASDLPPIPPRAEWPGPPLQPALAAALPALG